MINTNMRSYNYSTFGEDDGYGMATLSNIKGTIKMAINITSQSVQDNINYADCGYMGLTHSYIDDTYVINYGDKQLKVLYVNSMGRLKQVFMSEI